MLPSNQPRLKAGKLKWFRGLILPIPVFDFTDSSLEMPNSYKARLYCKIFPHSSGVSLWICRDYCGQAVVLCAL